MMECTSSSLPRKTTDIYVFVLLLVYPLFTGMDGYPSITKTKFVFLLSSTILWLVLTGFACLWQFIKRRSYTRIHLSSAQLMIALFLAACSVSSIISPYKNTFIGESGRFDGLVTYLIYGAIFLGVSIFGAPRKSHLWAFAVSISICCTVALLQLVGLNPLRLFPEGFCYYDAELYSTGEFLGTIGNVDLLSSLFCLSIPLFSTMYIRGKTASDKLFIIPSMLSLLVLLLSRVAGGVVALAVCVVICVPFVVSSTVALKRLVDLCAGLFLVLALVFAFSHEYTYNGLTIAFSIGTLSAFFLILCLITIAVSVFFLKKRTFSSKHIRRVLQIALYASVFAGGIAVYFWRPSSGTVFELSRLMHGELGDKFGSGRILIWHKVLQLVPSSLMFGGGPDTLVNRLDFAFKRELQDSGKLITGVVDNAHNEFLGILVNMGLVSLLAYLGVLVVSFKNLVMCWSRSTYIPIIAPALLSYLVQAFFGLGLCLVTPLFWLWWALAMARPLNDKAQSDGIISTLYN